MKSWWTKQSVRIDALSLRERVFLFLSAIACGLALADVVWLSPALVEHKQLTHRFEKQSSELQRARDELKAVAMPLDTTEAVRNKIAAVGISLGEVNQRIQDVLPVATDLTPLSEVLIHFLRRHEGLMLIRTSVLAPEAADLVPPGVAGFAGLPLGFTRQGVELTVSGPYPELVRYVQTLEKALPHGRWGAMKLESERLPPELTMQLFLLRAPS